MEDEDIKAMLMECIKQRKELKKEIKIIQNKYNEQMETIKMYECYTKMSKEEYKNFRKQIDELKNQNCDLMIMCADTVNIQKRTDVWKQVLKDVQEEEEQKQFIQEIRIGRNEEGCSEEEEEETGREEIGRNEEEEIGHREETGRNEEGCSKEEAKVVNIITEEKIVDKSERYYNMRSIIKSVALVLFSIVIVWFSAVIGILDYLHLI